MKARLALVSMDAKSGTRNYAVVCQGRQVGEVGSSYVWETKLWFAVRWIGRGDYVEAPNPFIRRGDAKRWVMANQRTEPE